MTTPSSSLKRARRRRPPHNREGSHDCSVAPSTQTHHGLLRPQRVRRGNLRRVFFPPLTRRALDRPDRRCQRRRQNRATTGIAPRRDARAAVFDAIPFSGRVDRGGTDGRVETARCRVAPTGGDPRADRARRANRTRPRAEIVRRARPTRGMLYFSVEHGFHTDDGSGSSRRERRGGFFFFFFKAFSRSTRSAPRRLPRRRTY